MTATSASSVHDSVVSSNGAGTAASSIATSPEASPKHERAEVCWSEPPPVPQRRRREVVSMLPSTELPLRSNLRPRPQSAIFESPTRSPARQALAPDYAIDYAQLVEEQREEIYKGECDADEKLMPSPLRIKKSAESVASYTPGDDNCLRRGFGGLDEAMSGVPVGRWRRCEV